MPNMKPDTSGLVPFTSERGRAAALVPRKSRLREPWTRMNVVLFDRQIATLDARSINRSDLVRQLLDDWLAKHP